MTTYLLVGGLVAAGFDETGQYLLTISHSGRGVFSTSTWERVARDYDICYPENGIGVGIGPIAGQKIPVREMTSDETMQLLSSDGRIRLHCESSAIEVECS